MTVPRTAWGLRVPRTAWGLRVLLCSLLYLQATQGSLIQDSLSCTNDYSTHWKCQWRENAAAHRLLPMTLYHWDSVGISPRSRCVPSGPQQDGAPELIWSSRVEQTNFIIHMTDYYTFLPERIVQREARITPAHRVRTPPPHGLAARRSEDGQVILSWEAPAHTDAPLTLLYQMTYRRRGWEEWEDAPSLNVLEGSEVTLDPRLLVTGSTYQFRVRTRPQEGKHHRGFWSLWSKELAWDVPEEDGAAPRNLQCEYDGFAELRCSWEVRTEVTTSVSYALYYTETPAEADSETPTSTNETSATGERACHPTLGRSVAGLPYILYSCTLQVPPARAHSSFLIRVRPQEEVKTFRPCLNIQPQPPLNLRVEERPGQGYMLNWSPQTVGNNIPLTSQLCYWKQGDPECPAHLLINVSASQPEYYIQGSDLQGSNQYTARVRSQLVGIKPNQCYSGTWSDWSHTYSWKPDVADWSLYYIAPLCTIVLLACVSVGFTYIKRSKKRWEDSLPNPSKSKLLSRYQPGFLSLSVATNLSEDSHAQEEDFSMCFQERQVDTWQLRDGDTEELVEEMPPKSHDCPLGPYALAPPAEEKIQCHPSIEELPGTGGPPNIPGLPLPSFVGLPSRLCCNSPYLICSRAHSLSDLGGMKKSRNPGYVTLPRCQAEVWGLAVKEVTSCGRSVPSGDQMGYVLGMGAQLPPPIPQQLAERGNSAQNSSYIPVPSPSDFQLPTEGPLMMINPDGSSPLMLRKVGDYCFFPGLHGSQERLEGNLAPPNGHKEHQELQDRPLPAVQAFKVMQSGYLALP